MVIYIVMGNSGCYEDEKDWVVTAYLDRADATKHVEAANEASEAYYDSIRDRPFSYSNEGLREYTGSLDPEAQALGSKDSGGATAYRIELTELRDSFVLR